MIQGSSERSQTIISLEYVEVYNETVNDLLKRKNCNLELKLDPVQGVVIKGLT